MKTALLEFFKNNTQLHEAFWPAATRRYLKNESRTITENNSKLHEKNLKTKTKKI